MQVNYQYNIPKHITDEDQFNLITGLYFSFKTWIFILVVSSANNKGLNTNLILDPSILLIICLIPLMVYYFFHRKAKIIVQIYSDKVIYQQYEMFKLVSEQSIYFNEIEDLNIIEHKSKYSEFEISHSEIIIKRYRKKEVIQYDLVPYKVSKDLKSKVDAYKAKHSENDPIFKNSSPNIIQDIDENALFFIKPKKRIVLLIFNVVIFLFYMPVVYKQFIEPSYMITDFFALFYSYISSGFGRIFFAVFFIADIYAIYLSLASIINKFQINVMAESILVKYGPIPFLKFNIYCPKNKVKQVYISLQEHEPHFKEAMMGKKEKVLRYSLNILTYENEIICLCDRIQNYNQALEIEQFIEAKYRLIDKPVKDEVPKG